MQKIRIQGTGLNSTKLKENNEIGGKITRKEIIKEGIKEQRCELKWHIYRM